MPVGTRSGSSISLKAASGRQACGSPYSVNATDARVSPAIVPVHSADLVAAGGGVLLPGRLARHLL